MPKPNVKEIKQLLINDFGYQPVDLESYTGQLRALKESLNSLKIKNPKDPRVQQLTNAIKDLKADREVEKSGGKLKHTRKRRSDAKSYEQIKAEIDAKDKGIADRKAAKRAEARLLGIEKRVENNSKKITLLKNILKAGKLNVGEKIKGLDPVNSPLNESIQSITDSVTSIHQTLLDQQELDKDKQDDIAIDAEQDTRDAKESSREGGSSIGEGLKKTGAKMLAPVTNAFDQIKEWLFKFFAAKAIMMFIKWFSDPTNAKKVSSLFRFIKDWWPAILTGILLFAGSMLGPGGIIIGITALVVGFIPKIVNSIKTLFGFTKDVNKEAAKGEKEADKALKGEGTETSSDKFTEEDIGSTVTPRNFDDLSEGEQKNLNQMMEKKNFNKGGEVPGTGNQDTVPAMLTPGEFVMSKGAVEQYGIDTLEGMNAAAGGTNKPEEVTPPVKAMKGGGPVMPQTPLVRGYSGGGEVLPPEDKKKQAPELNKETGKLAKRIEPLVTGQPPGMGGIGGALMSVAEKHPAVMLAKGIGNLIGKGMGKVGDMMKKKEPDLDLKEAIAYLQKRFNYSIYDGNYKPQGGGSVSEPKESGGGGGDPLAGFISAVSSLPIVGKPLAKATGLLVGGVEKIIDDKLQLSGNQKGTVTPDAPTRPTTTVAYAAAKTGAQGGGGGGSTGNPGGKVPSFSAGAKLSKQKIKVLGISR